MTDDREVKFSRRQIELFQEISDQLGGLEFAVLALSMAHHDKEALTRTVDAIASQMKGMMDETRAAAIIKHMRMALGVGDAPSSGGPDDGQ